jgi:hypothetical protein
MEHFLITKAEVIPPRGVPVLSPDWEYDIMIGAWVRKGTDRLELLVRSPERPRPVTKKADQETGEDLKGE